MLPLLRRVRAYHVGILYHFGFVVMCRLHLVHFQSMSTLKLLNLFFVRLPQSVQAGAALSAQTLHGFDTRAEFVEYRRFFLYCMLVYVALSTSRFIVVYTS